MDQTQQWTMMRNALSSIGFDSAEVSSFDEDTLDKLCAAKFHLPGRLQSATREDLKEVNLAVGDVSFIVSKVQGIVAGPGPGSTGAGSKGILPHHKAREKVVTNYFACDKNFSSVFVPLFPKVLVTHHHGKHESWQPGHTLEVLINDNTADSQKTVQAKVLAIHPEVDVVFLTVEQCLLEAPNLDIGVQPGEPYMVLGCSNRSQVKPFSVSHGVVSTTVPDKKGFIRGDSQSLQGESGSGCFSSETGKLIAMNIGRDKAHGNRAMLVSVAVLLALLQKNPGAPIPDVDWGEGD